MKEKILDWLLDWLIDDLTPWIVLVIFVIVILAVTSLVAAIPTLFLWNWLLPEIFAIKAITFWQAWGINFLASVLFKSVQTTKK